jgi:hypothetical protein
MPRDESRDKDSHRRSRSFDEDQRRGEPGNYIARDEVGNYTRKNGRTEAWMREMGKTKTMRDPEHVKSTQYQDTVERVQPKESRDYSKLCFEITNGRGELLRYTSITTTRRGAFVVDKPPFEA